MRRALGRRAAWRAAQRAGAREQHCDTAALHCDTAAWPATRPGNPTTTRRDTAPGHACARLGVLAGPAGCALGALSLFLTQFD